MTDFANKLKGATTPPDVLQVAAGFQSEAAKVKSTAAKAKTFVHDDCKQ